MDFAPYFSRENAFILERAPPRLDSRTAFTENYISLFLYLLADNGRNNLPCFVFIKDPFFLRQKTLLTGAVIHNFYLVAALIALILRILNDTVDGVVVYTRTVSVAVALFPKNILDLPGTVVTCRIQLIYQPYHFGFGFIYRKLAVVLVISEYAAVSHYITVFDSTFVSPAHTLGELPYFICCYT